MFTIPDNLEPPEWLDGDVDFLAKFIVDEVKRNEFIHTYNAITGGI